LVLLYAFATPAVAGLLNTSLKSYPPLRDVAQAAPAGAIVVLGAGRYQDAPEYGGTTLKGAGLERVRYAAWLSRRTGLPILASGGDPEREGIAEAVLMKTVFEEEFGVKVSWVEGHSDNTHENALYSREMLARERIDTIVLVTHATHMPRALRAFVAAGFAVIPAPTVASASKPFEAADLIPRAGAMGQAARALHELLGGAWYALAY
jgi:uncharacterized SAM-binding protein YcdF (DUF218 family)